MQEKKSNEDLACEYCEKSFSSKRGLDDHKDRIHYSTTNKSKYKCQVCSEELNDEHRYNIHMKKHDGYKCDECGKLHPSYKLLYQHMAYNHLGKAKCSQC